MGDQMATTKTVSERLKSFERRFSKLQTEILDLTREREDDKPVIADNTDLSELQALAHSCGHWSWRMICFRERSQDQK